MRFERPYGASLVILHQLENGVAQVEDECGECKG
jgi:hypothetical protein